MHREVPGWPVRALHALPTAVPRALALDFDRERRRLVEREGEGRAAHVPRVGARA